MPPELVPLLSKAGIQERVSRLGRQICADYEGKSLVVVGILKGSFIFLADLVRELRIPVRIDFVRLASYGSDRSSSGQVHITKDLEIDIRDQYVLIVEDIIDSGLTIAYLLDYLKQFQPRSIKTCTFIDKRERRTEYVPIDYRGHIVESGFLVGYGLDWNENYRALPEIYCLKA